MRQFNIGEYSLFNEGTTIINNSLKTLSHYLTNATVEMNKLKSSNVFDGPISDSVLEGWNKISESASVNVIILNSASITLSRISALYQNSDDTNARSIGSV